MRQTISGLVAAFAVTAVSAAPAMACGGLLGSYCSPCAGTTYASPCEPVYAPPVFATGCNTCGGWGYYERLAEPTTQYYYVNQGPTYTGPGAFGPYPFYQESAIPNPDLYRYYRHGYDGRYAAHHGYHWHHHYYYRPWHHSYRHYSMRYSHGHH